MRLALGLLMVLSTHAAADCPQTKRIVFDPPTKRHSMPQLTLDGKGYAIVGYDGPPFAMHLSTLDATGKPRSTKLGAGGVMATATSGDRIGIVFVVEERGRYQSYFMAVGRDGKVAVPRVALGDRTLPHSAPGPAVAWNPQAKEWAALWVEGHKLQLARLDETGKLLDTRELSARAVVAHQSPLVWTGSRYAYVMAVRAGMILYEVDGQTVRETAINAASAMEPVVAYGAGTYGIAFRSEHELAFVRVKDGRELGRTLVQSMPAPRPIGAIAGTPVPKAPYRAIGSMTIAADGGGFVLVWAEGAPARFDDRLMIERFDATGFPLGAPRRLDGEEIHQGYASIAGTGCDLAVSYILGDPNAAVRVAVAHP